jgi:hypothetical protein
MEDACRDFPAAHSMDTTWFGVDEDGELAVFESGEGGSVPIAYDRPPDSTAWWDVFKGCPLDDKRIRHIPVDGAALARLCAPEALQKNLRAHKARSYSVNVPIRYASEEAVIEAQVDGPGYWIEPIRFAGEEIVVLYPEGVPWDEIEKRIATGGVIGIGPVSDGRTRLDAEAEAQGLVGDQLIGAMDAHERKYLHKFRMQPEEDWAQNFLGFHFYGADDFSTIYDASRRPVKPLTLEDLPLDEETRKGLVRFPGVRFAEAAAIQPLALMESAQWGDMWAGVDGSLHGRQSFDGGLLRNENGEPYPREAMWRMGIRPIGTLPVRIDYSAWEAMDAAANPPSPRGLAPVRSSWLSWLGLGPRRK